MSGFVRDLRYALRQLRRNPGLSVAVIFTLALGIGANTAVFSIVSGVLLRPLPFPEADRLATLDPPFFLPGEYALVRQEGRAWEHLAGYRAGVGFNLSVDGVTERVIGAEVTPEFFATLGVPPLLGRGFLAEEGTVGQDRVVVLAHSLWNQRFGGDRGALGMEILVDSEPRTVVGVMPAGFDFPAGSARLWVPAAVDAADLAALWGGGQYSVVGRLAPGIGPEGARAEFEGLAARMRESNPLWSPPEGYRQDTQVVALREAIVGDVGTRLLLLLGAVGFVLLIACTNVANLLLVRGVSRRRELAIRSALGSSRGRIVRQLLTESGVLALLGGAAGVLLAGGGLRFLVAALPPDTPRLGEVALDGWVLAFTIAVTLLVGMAVGLLPAGQGARDGIRRELVEGGSGLGSSRGARRLTQALIVGEVALAVVLVTGAGLLVRSFLELSQVDPGFQAESVLSARITPPDTRYATPDAIRAFYSAFLEEAAALPGAGRVALASRVPLESRDGGFAFEVEGDPYVPGTAAPMVGDTRVSPDYLALMGIPLLQGRPLTAADHAGAQKVALINEAMAREHWPGEDPVGKRFKPVWWQEWITVVGVVGDVRQQELAAEALPEVIRPFAQEPAGIMTILVESAGVAPGGLAPGLRIALANVDPQVPLSEIRTLDQLVAGSVATPRTTTALLGLFAALALGLAAVGIYGVIAYTVSRRTREFGLRIALGARGAHIGMIVLRQGIGMVGAGVVLGLAGALAAARLMEGLLFGVSPRDPLTFALVPVILLSVALVACLIPTRRAIGVDPMTTLREE